MLKPEQTIELLDGKAVITQKFNASELLSKLIIDRENVQKNREQLQASIARMDDNIKELDDVILKLTPNEEKVIIGDFSIKPDAPVVTTDAK